MKDEVSTIDPLDRLIEITAALKKFRAVIEEALTYADNSHSFDRICERVIYGDLLMYPMDNAILLCEVTEAPNFKTFHVYLGGGDLEEMLDAQPMIEADALLFDCKYVSMTGRLGWKPHFEKRGWKHTLSIYKKEL